MNEKLLTKAASIDDLKARAKSKIPAFAYDYVHSGCNADLALRINRLALDSVRLRPNYLNSFTPSSLDTDLFGKRYSAPLGIAPIGLSGIVWPEAPLIHAKTAFEKNIPFILSSVSTTSIEKAAERAKENFWFQLYPPKDRRIRSDMLRRTLDAGSETLVVTIDVPSLSWRPRDIKNGLGIPPRITPRSIVQSLLRPHWSAATLLTGFPSFETLQPYIAGTHNLKNNARLIRHTLREVVDKSVINEIRREWPGILIIKGIMSESDAKAAVDCGADGLIVSNHGGRQLDAAQSPIDVLPSICDAVGQSITVMADSGIESGVDIARFLASGAKAVFSGRAFLYGAAAFQLEGSGHAYDILTSELKQLLEQLHCKSVDALAEHLVQQH